MSAPCTYNGQSGEMVAGPCPQCGHILAMHPSMANPNLTACVICSVQKQTGDATVWGSVTIQPPVSAKRDKELNELALVLTREARAAARKHYLSVEERGLGHLDSRPDIVSECAPVGLVAALMLLANDLDIDSATTVVALAKKIRGLERLA